MIVGSKYSSDKKTSTAVSGEMCILQQDVQINMTFILERKTLVLHFFINCDNTCTSREVWKDFENNAVFIVCDWS